MSQIVTINKVEISNLNLAKKVATDLGWTESSNKNVSGIASGNNGVADIVYDVKGTRHNIGLRKTSNGNYEILCDNDIKSRVVKDFVVPYTSEFVVNSIKLKGKVFSKNSGVTVNGRKKTVIEYEA